MADLTRRLFVHDGLRVVSVGLALPHLFTKAVQAADLEAGRTPSVRVERGNGDPLARRTIVVVQMAGGNDGLNAVVPHGDSAYRDHRPTLGLGPGDVLPLDERFALHGAMGGLHRLWGAGEMAIVHGVGYPKPSYSHFESMDVWQTGAVEAHNREGVLARLVKDVVDGRGHPFAGFAASRSVPPALASPDLSVSAVENPATFAFVPDKRHVVDGASRHDALLHLSTAPGMGGGFHQAFASTARLAHDTVATVQHAHAAYAPLATYPADGFAAGLRLVSEAICGDLGVRVAYITLGGFDTHAGQKATQARLLGTLSDGLAAFWADLQAHGRADDVLVMTWSEFGRRVPENASGGSDHGSAGPQFIIGKGIRHGHWGAPPSLSDLDHGNLRHTTDFRSVYATVMEGWLGAPSVELLGARFPRLGFLPTHALGG